MPKPGFNMAAVAAAVIAVLLTPGAPAHAGYIDPTGDFLPSYTGIKGADLDVIAYDATFDGMVFHLSATLNGAIGTTAGALYVWGVDRGAGTERFLAGTPSIGAGVKFDSALVLRPNGTGSFIDIVGGGTSTALPTSNINITGSTITADLPLSFAPSKGFAAADYGFNLWPRLGVGQNSQISDFAPDAADFKATLVPEPASAMVFGVAMAGLAALRRRTPKRASQCAAA